MGRNKLSLNGPDVWEPLSKEINSVYGSSLIAGGSPRDWVINKNLIPRDIDFFVPVESELDLELGMPDLGFFQELRLLGKSNNYHPSEGQESNVIGVIEGWAILNADGRREELKINIIGKSPEKVADPYLLIKDFDHSLCQVFVDPYKFDVVVSEPFNKTLDTGVIQVYNEDIRTKQRLDIMKKRGKSFDRFTYPEDAFKNAKSKSLLHRYSVKDVEANDLILRDLADLENRAVAAAGGLEPRLINWDQILRNRVVRGVGAGAVQL